MLTLWPAGRPRGAVVFGAGAGGDPDRYADLLAGLADAGFAVAAPVAQRLDGRDVTPQQLRDRVVGLQAALSSFDDPTLPVIAAGHSLGGCAALCLAGARPWGRDRQPIAVPTEARVTRLVLLAPALDWFRAPEALAGVRVPIVVHAGAGDVVTPVRSTDLLRSCDVRVRVYADAGHFDFMSTPPPGVPASPGLDRAAFLQTLTSQLVDDLA